MTDVENARFETSGHTVYWETPERMVVAAGGGCTIAIGLALLAAGVFCILGGTTVLWGWPPGLDIPGVQWPTAMLVLGIVLSLIGLSSATYHARTVFDREGKSWRRKGSVLLVVNLYRRGSFEDMEAVHINRETRSSGGGGTRHSGSTFVYYPVSLKCRDAYGKDFDHSLGEFAEKEKAQKAAQAVSAFLEIPVREEA